MRGLAFGAVVAFLTFGMGGCFVLGCIMAGFCFSAGERSAAWVRKEVRTGMHMPQLVHLAESAPSNENWGVALKNARHPRTPTSFMLVETDTSPRQSH